MYVCTYLYKKANKMTFFEKNFKDIFEKDTETEVP